jgi:transmembrane 9 superfamily member 2/4
VHTLLPYDYYSLKFCKPGGGVKPYSENLGEFLRGDRIENSAYEVSILCTVKCFFVNCFKVYSLLLFVFANG